MDTLYSRTLALHLSEWANTICISRQIVKLGGETGSSDEHQAALMGVYCSIWLKAIRWRWKNVR